MKNVIKIISFLIYSILIFLIKPYQFSIIVFIINMILTIALKISIKDEIRNILSVLLFIIITAGINILVVDIRTGIMIGIKLILVCNITFIFSKRINCVELSEALEKIFAIFKFLKINPKNISIMVCISISFIPTLKKQIKQTNDALKSKGIKINLKNSNLIFRPLMISLFKRVDEIENSLKAKAYEEI